MLKIRSIQISIVLWVGVCLLVALGVMTAYSAVTVKNNTIEAAENEVLSQTRIQANAIETQMEVSMDAARTMAQMLAAQVKSEQPLTRDQVIDLLKGVLEQNPSFFGVATEWEPNAFDGQDSIFAGSENTDETGHFSPYWYRDGNELVLTYLPVYDENDPAYQYYMIPKRTLEETVIDPYFYPLGNEQVLMTSFSAPIIVNGKFFGVADVDMRLDFIQGISDQIVDVDPNAKLTIIANAGTLAGVTGFPDLLGQPLTALAANAADQIKGVQAGEEYVTNINSYFVASVPLFIGENSKPWAAQMAFPEENLLAEAYRMRWVMIAIGVVLFIVTLVILYFVAGSIAKPIKVITKGAILLSQGDANLTGLDKKTTAAITRRSDELGEIGRAFYNLVGYFSEMAEKAQAIANRDLSVKIEPKGKTDVLGNTFISMIDGLRETIQQVLANADQVTESSDQLANISNQAGHATNQIATTIQQVAHGTTQQAEAINLTASSTEQVNKTIAEVAKGATEQANAAARMTQLTSQLSEAIEQVAGNANSVVNNSSAATDAAKHGAETVNQTLAGMQAIKTTVGLSAQKVQEMGSRSDQIGSIITTIEDIASQTNLLALNAAIEAARAGEAGKGFAVVADEVRKLAERSSTSTKEIGDLIKGIQKTVEEAVAAMDQGAKEVETGVELANDAGRALNEILNVNNEVKSLAEQAAQAARQMGAFANDLVSAVDSVSAIVEENTAATEEMAASSSEVAHAVENIASVSEENSAAVEEVSASTEEVSAQVGEVAASAQALAALAETLKQVVSQFKLN